MEKLIIAKIGGKVIDQRDRLGKFLSDFSKVSYKKILVHGGGKIATDIGLKIGIDPKIVEGRRVTDAATLDLVTMVYGGLLNKNIVSQLQSFNCNAIGLTGADANIILATKRKVGQTDYGFVGDIVEINLAAIKYFLNYKLVPVLAPLTHDETGKLLNTNADTIATAVAKTASEEYQTELIFCFEQPGILKENGSVISRINFKEYQVLKTEKTVSDGMIPKLDNAFFALKSGITRIVICQSQNFLDVVYRKKPLGSELVLDSL
jgi:acetylglutamate kinase